MSAQSTPAWHSLRTPARLGDEPSPEMRLVLAVFEDGIRAATRRPDAGRRRQQRLYREARAWVEDDDRAWPFAFANVCELLGLDPSAVRQRVLLGCIQPDTDRRRTRSGRWGRPHAALTPAGDARPGPQTAQREEAERLTQGRGS